MRPIDEVQAETTALIAIALAEEFKKTERLEHEVKRLCERLQRLRIIVGLEREERAVMVAENRVLRQKCAQYEAMFDDAMAQLAEKP